MISILKKIPWWGWAAAAVAILLFINNANGSVYTRKLWNMMADQIRVDQSNIVKTLEETVNQREAEIADLEEKIKVNKIEIANVRKEKDRLIGRVFEIQGQRQNIVVSSNPDRIVDDLRQLGFRTVHRGYR